MLTSIEHLMPENLDWQKLYRTWSYATTLTAIVLTAWQMGLWLANQIVCQHLQKMVVSQRFLSDEQPVSLALL